MKLYEFTTAAQDLYDLLIEESDLKDAEREQIIIDTMESMGADEKLESYCKVIRQLEADAEMLKTEKKRLDEAKSRCEKSLERMKKATLDFYNATGAEKPITAGTFRISKRKSESTKITDEQQIPEMFCKVKREVSVADIKAAIKAGREVPGAEIVENYSIQIK